MWRSERGLSETYLAAQAAGVRFCPEAWLPEILRRADVEARWVLRYLSTST